ncbi:FAD/NAD-P-binding domain-containing protein [Mycena alexandri]|uniref:FAD/NAD-P-binding domain-containing protein n=1 Tax=Mycena alexandri TaxID=1745969 RepID=A0AAD6SRM1_9AGAR|nr:FAD/NAD-P-binding domain-containing protein [Mycena alexandri]
MSRFAVATVLLATAILRVIGGQTVFNSAESTGSPWTTFPRPITRVAVIGAGPAGLQAAAHLLEAILTVRLFERAPSLGGNWCYTEETPVREEYPQTNSKLLEDLPDKYPATRYHEEGDSGIALEERWRKHWQPRPVWYALRTNTPAPITRLPGVEYPSDTPWRVSVHDVQRHIRAYASLSVFSTRFPVAVYSTRVEGIQKCNDTITWTLTLRRLEWLTESKRLKATYWTENFDAVVIATGLYTFPYSFPQTILVVGAWVSATEIARNIGPFTNRLIASVKIILATGYRPTNLGGPGTLGISLDGQYPPFQKPIWFKLVTAARTWTHGGYQILAFAKVWTGKARLPSREQMWEDHQNQNPCSPVRAFLNAESLELGGKFVEPLPVETREIEVYFFNAHWKNGWLSHENFTWLDDLPRNEWPTPPTNGLDATELPW